METEDLGQNIANPFSQYEKTLEMEEDSYPDSSILKIQKKVGSYPFQKMSKNELTVQNLKNNQNERIHTSKSPTRERYGSSSDMH